MTKSDILNALDNLGFSVDELNEHFIRFEYEEVNYLYTHDDTDEDFFHLSIPAIFQVTDDNADMVMNVINHANNIIKYAKIFYSQELVWATFEYPLFEWVNLEEILEFAIKVLQNAAVTFNRILRGDFDDTDGEEEEQ